MSRAQQQQTQKPKDPNADVIISMPMDTSKNVPYDPSRIYTAVEKLPVFPGGFQAFYKYLAQNIHYPASAVKNRIHGKVYVTFVVEKDGSLANIKVARGIGDGCDEEALRVMRMSPPWQPGMQNGKPVRVAYTIPIAFISGN